MKRLLITGASGYIGRAFIETHGFRYKLRLFGRRPIEQNEEFVTGDIRNLVDVDKAMRDIDCVIHLAAVTTDQTGISDIDFFKSNTLGTLNVLEAAAKNKVSKVVYGSSVCAVGFRAASSKIRETDKCRPSDGMYGYSKYLSERLCEYYAEKYGISIICLRTAMVVPQHELVRPVNPMKSRWLGAVHIEDVADAYRLAVEKDGIDFEIFHIAASSSSSMFDITKAGTVLGYKPQYDFSEHLHQKLSRTVTGVLKRMKDKFMFLKYF